MPSIEAYFRNQRWIPAINNEGEDMPAFGIVQITDVRSDGVLVVNKTTDATGITLAIIDNLGIKNGKLGYVTQDLPAIALSGGVSAIPGALTRPKVGAYTLDAADSIANLVILGDFSGQANTVWVDKCNRCQIGT